MPLETEQQKTEGEVNRKKNYVVHEFLANPTDLFGQCSGEHHNLLVVRSELENALDILTHVLSVSKEY